MEAYSGEGGKPRCAGVSSLRRADKCCGLCGLLLQRKPVRSWTLKLDLENLRGKFTGVICTGRQGGTAAGAGNGADGEGKPAAK